MSNLFSGIGGAGPRMSAALNNLRTLVTSAQSFTRRQPATFATALKNSLGSGTATSFATPFSLARQSNVLGQVSASVAAAVIVPPAAVEQPGPQTIASATAPVRDSFVAFRPKQDHYYADDPVDDAYWAKQPPAVQQLREIDDYDTRHALVTQLVAQGYTIDVPIMDWGWDAGRTTAIRKQYGYTWVPSALQQPVQIAPGLTVPGSNLTPYDPKNPPPGSILV